MQNISRILVGVVTIPIVIAIILYLPATFFLFLLLILLGLGLYEYFSLIEVDDITFPRWKELFAFIGMGIPVTAYLWGLNGILASFFTLLAFLMILTMGRLTSYEHAFTRAGGIFLGYFFIAVPLSMAMLILMMAPHGRSYILWMVLIVWAGDTGAFYLGTMFGKHKLYPKVSPKKSVEGVIGGILSALVVAVIARLFLSVNISQYEVLILPPILLVLGQLGDFSESMLKRGAGAKDSGRILAGHGGILDRIDSFLFTIPFFYIYLFLRL
jgi:phosphatidate cytidylyltransferase